MKSPYRHCKYTLKSKFGELIIIGRYDDQKILRVFLPGQHRLFKSSDYRHAVEPKSSDRIVHRVCTVMDKLLQGKPAIVPLDMLDWSVAYPFQRRVLLLEYRIPHGMVSTYGRLAQKLGHARAGRAVGTALARNPFPVMIPCHRAIRSDRTLGGYGGGLLMKRRLLELEGVHFDRYGRVLVERFW